MAGEEVGVVAADAERGSAEHRHVVGLAGIGDPRVGSGQPVVVGQRVDLGSRGVADDVVVAVVLVDEQEHVVVMRECGCCAGGARRGERGDGPGEHGDRACRCPTRPGAWVHCLLRSDGRPYLRAVMAFEGAEAGPVPAQLAAVTVNV